MLVPEARSMINVSLSPVDVRKFINGQIMAVIEQLKMNWQSEHVIDFTSMTCMPYHLNTEKKMQKYSV